MRLYPEYNTTIKQIYGAKNNFNKQNKSMKVKSSTEEKKWLERSEC
jgi:hypothetical protein